MKTKIYLLVFFMLAMAWKISAQDLHFSQFYERPLLRNPALSGLFNGDLRISMTYRDQWGSITVPFRTTAVSIEHKMPLTNYNDVFTLGAHMNMDCAGDVRLKRTQIMPSIAFHKSLSDEKDTYLSLAFTGGHVSSRFDITQLRLGDQYKNGSFNASNSTNQSLTHNGYAYWDMGAGIAFSTVLNNQTRFYIGSALAHFTKPVIKSSTGSESGTVAPKLSANIGLHGKLGTNNHIIAFSDYYAQAGSSQWLTGFMYGVSTTEFEGEEPSVIYFGSFLRYGDAVIPVVKMEFNNIGIGVSYDINISKLRTASKWRGGLELTASYKGFLKIRNSTLDRVRCVKF